MFDSFASFRPLPEIRWSRRDWPLPYDRLEYDNYGKTLRIKDVVFEDAGKYDCNASNGVGLPVSLSFDVKVVCKQTLAWNHPPKLFNIMHGSNLFWLKKAKPYFIIEPEIVHAAETETIAFQCSAGGNCTSHKKFGILFFKYVLRNIWPFS